MPREGGVNNYSPPCSNPAANLAVLRRPMTVKIVENWLEQFVSTALEGGLAAHMAMISRDVLVFGVPGFDALEFDDWYRQ